MKYKIQNTRMLTPTEFLMILCKSATLYSEYADTTLLFIFREKSQICMTIIRSDMGKIILCIWQE